MPYECGFQVRHNMQTHQRQQNRTALMRKITSGDVRSYLKREVTLACHMELHINYLYCEDVTR